MLIIPGKNKVVCGSIERLFVLLAQCLLISGLFFVSSIVLAQEASVRAELSAPVITRDESVLLTITAVGIDAELDASALDADFDVIGRSSSRQVNIVTDASGRRDTSIVTWTLELVPHTTGVFTVPAVNVGPLQTQLLTLTVNDTPTGAARDIFIESRVDTTTPWVQSQVLLTLSIYQAVDIIDGGLDMPGGDDLQVERLGEDTRRSEVRDGRAYSVTERRFALFPQKSGPLVIEPVSLSVTVPADRSQVRGFFSPTRKLTRRTEPLTLDVRPRPGSGAGWWLPARALRLDSQWQGERLNAQVDQPLTRTLVVRAEGVMAAQLPEITIPQVEGLSLYAEEPQRSEAAGPAGIVSEQRISWALIPQRAGTVELPPVTLSWFNTITGQEEVAVLAAEQIVVQAPAAVSQPGVANTTAALTDSGQQPDSSAVERSERPSDLTAGALDEAKPESVPGGRDAALTGEALAESPSTRWRTLAIVMFGVWLLTLLALYYWYQRRTARVPASDSGYRERDDVPPVSVEPLRQACEKGDPATVKASVLVWAQQQWPDMPPATLDDLIRRLPEGKARMLLQHLDRALYSQNVTLSMSFAELPAALRTAAEALSLPSRSVSWRAESVSQRLFHRQKNTDSSLPSL